MQWNRPENVKQIVILRYNIGKKGSVFVFQYTFKV